MEHEIRHKEILQSSFDLLGELVKFNIEAFQTFDSIFTTQQKVSAKRSLVRERGIEWKVVTFSHLSPLGYTRAAVSLSVGANNFFSLNMIPTHKVWEFTFKFLLISTKEKDFCDFQFAWTKKSFQNGFNRFYY